MAGVQGHLQPCLQHRVNHILFLETSLILLLEGPTLHLEHSHWPALWQPHQSRPPLESERALYRAEVNVQERGRGEEKGRSLIVAITSPTQASRRVAVVVTDPADHFFLLLSQPSRGRVYLLTFFPSLACSRRYPRFNHLMLVTFEKHMMLSFKNQLNNECTFWLSWWRSVLRREELLSQGSSWFSTAVGRRCPFISDLHDGDHLSTWLISTSGEPWLYRAVPVQAFGSSLLGCS